MPSTTTSEEQTTMAKWFEEMVATLRTHQVMLETDTAPESIKATYEILMNGTEQDMHYKGKLSAQMYFVKSILLDYIKELGTALPRKIAVNFNDSEVLVWAEIEDDNEDMEEQLLVAEAKVNAKYHDYGFDMETTIVEESDRFPIPSNYQLLK